MIRKIAVFGILTAILHMPARSDAQPIDPRTLPNGTIVVLRTEETGVPGYVHQQYMFVDDACPGSKIVDYYGPPIDPNDPDLRNRELRLCLDSRDGGGGHNR